MNFEQWWEQLSDAERRFIGIHSARFIWVEAYQVGFTEGFTEGQDAQLGEADANN